METIKYETGEHYVEIEVSEAIRSQFALIRAETIYEEAEGERAFLERAVARLDTLGRITCLEDGVRPYDAEKFEAAQAAGRNSMRFVQALYRWGHLNYYSSKGEWTLHGSFLRGNDGTEWLVNIWPRGYYSSVEVIEDV